MDNFIAELKAATESLHRNAEQAGILKQIMSPALNQELYSEYLNRAYSMHREVENTVFPIVKNIIRDTDQRLKSDHILSDLHANGSQPSSSLSFLNGMHETSPDFNLGLAYVSEGSVLGGQFILKHVRRVLGAEAPGRFLNVYGESTGTSWKAFAQQLNDYAKSASASQREEMIRGALYGFERAAAVFA